MFCPVVFSFQLFLLSAVLNHKCFRSVGSQHFSNCFLNESLQILRFAHNSLLCFLTYYSGFFPIRGCCTSIPRVQNRTTPRCWRLWRWSKSARSDEQSPWWERKGFHQLQGVRVICSIFYVTSLHVIFIHSVDRAFSLSYLLSDPIWTICVMQFFTGPTGSV